MTFGTPTFENLVSPETRFADVGDLELEGGGYLPEVRVAYRCWGQPQRRAILICHALTGSADANDWWPGMIGAGAPFDPSRDFVICSNVLGSCYGTTGPTSFQPTADTEEPRLYRADFPPVSIRDMVHLQARLLDHLGVERLELVTGGSMGGMQALEWAVLYPERVDSLAPIAVSARHSAWCIGLSEAQRFAIRSDPAFRDGHYDIGSGPVAGLAAARMIAICSYRSRPSFELRFGRERRDPEMFEVESYLRHQGRKLTERFDPNAYLALTSAMDTHDLGRGRDRSALEVLTAIDQPALVVSVSSDVLYPPEEQLELERHLPNASLATIESPHGHDAFLIEMDQLSEFFREFRRAFASP